MTLKIRGEAILPDDPHYDAARCGFNSVYAARPAVIARVRDAHDVRDVIAYASSEGLPLTVRSGGHSLAGLGTIEGGVVIDLHQLNSAEVDASAPLAWIGAGMLAGDVAEALDEHSLVLPLGDSPTVGIGGLTLGGGIGWLSRKFGLTLDSLVAAEMVTSGGGVLIADRDNHPDLFWALRGGGGNFGVVTRFCFRPHKLADVLGGSMTLPLTRETLVKTLAVIAAAPNELGVIALAMRGPPGLVTEAAEGQPVLHLTLVWSGLPAAGEAVMDRLRGVVAPIGEKIETMRYKDMFRLAEGAPDTVTDTTESVLADDLDAAATDAIIAAVGEEPLPDSLSAIEIRVLGGAIMDTANTETAFAHRDRQLMISAVRAGFPIGDYDLHRAWVVSLGKQFAGIAKGKYLNFIERVEADNGLVYPEPTARRLARVKQQYDPAGLFGRSLRTSTAA